MSFPLNVQIIQHEEFVAPGEYLRWAERRGCPVSITKCWALDAFPEAGALPDLLVVLGGSQNPGMTEADDPHFFAAAEKELIRRCAEAGRMVVGACLGAQLLGEAMGAPYDHSPERELGPTPLTLTAADNWSGRFEDQPVFLRSNRYGRNLRLTAHLVFQPFRDRIAQRL